MSDSVHKKRDSASGSALSTRSPTSLSDFPGHIIKEIKRRLALRRWAADGELKNAHLLSLRQLALAQLAAKK